MVLIVSKTNGRRHIEHIPHSSTVLANLAKNLGHASYVTENAAVFNDEQLKRFSVVVLNSASGDFLSPNQRAAFARFVARDGGVVALHAAGDNSQTDPWYAKRIIGTKFTGRPGGKDHFQPARIAVDQPDHSTMAGVKLPWSPVDEWYSFYANAAARGRTVLARIDEASYRRRRRTSEGSAPGHLDQSIGEWPDLLFSTRPFTGCV